MRGHLPGALKLRDTLSRFQPCFWRNLARFYYKTEKTPREIGVLWYSGRPMSIPKKTAFSRRLPDLVTEELSTVLKSRSSYEFKELFDLVHERLRARNAASGGEEMLRLRAYEKLQNLVSRGMVKKDGKKYKGIPKQLATLVTTPPPIPQPAAVA